MQPYFAQMKELSPFFNDFQCVLGNLFLFNRCRYPENQHSILKKDALVIWKWVQIFMKNCHVPSTDCFLYKHTKCSNNKTGGIENTLRHPYHRICLNILCGTHTIGSAWIYCVIHTIGSVWIYSVLPIP